MRVAAAFLTGVWNQVSENLDGKQVGARVAQLLSRLCGTQKTWRGSRWVPSHVRLIELVEFTTSVLCFTLFGLACKSGMSVRVHAYGLRHKLAYWVQWHWHSIAVQ